MKTTAAGMPRDQDLRLKLTAETHRVLGELARGADSTLQAYVERLILSHIHGRLEEARRLVAVADPANIPKVQTPRQRLYFVQRWGPEGPIKIGVTSGSGKGRLKQLQTASEELLTLLHECDQSDTITERAVHRRFRDSRLEGEWFKATPELLTFINEQGVSGK